MRVTDYINRVIVKHPETLRNFRAIVDAVDNGQLEGYHVEITGRIRRWAYIADADKYFRIIFLSDGETVFNVFPDNQYTRQKRKEQDNE